MHHLNRNRDLTGEHQGFYTLLEVRTGNFSRLAERAQRETQIVRVARPTQGYVLVKMIELEHNRLSSFQDCLDDIGGEKSTGKEFRT
jgi:hypothetical protein